jgi:hypothetical protein
MIADFVLMGSYAYDFIELNISQKIGKIDFCNENKL